MLITDFMITFAISFNHKTMKQAIYYLCISLLSVATLVACDDSRLLEDIEMIKALGDSDPASALSKADSLRSNLARADEYTQMKYLLLKQRLSDKLHIMPESDGNVEYLVDYFEEEGDARDLQETYYYTAKVYLHLNDIPRALSYLHKSSDAALDTKNCDTLMLKDTRALLSNISKSSPAGYRYFKDSESDKLQKEKYQDYRLQVMLDSVIAVCMVFMFVMIILYIKSRHSKEVLSLDSDIANLEQEQSALRLKTETLQDEINVRQKQIEDAKQKLADVSAELVRVESELRLKEEMLNEKIAENKHFVTLLHKAELTEKAEDMVTSIRKASEGRYHMTDDEWQRLYHAIDELQPTLMERMVKHLGRFTEQQQRVCYLLSIGLTNAQIENLTDIPHATVWRWTKKFSWVY